jgi:Lon protease-like protein
MLSSAKPPICADLPLFPLHTVLFPGGLLPLKIFETRYLDMARECLRDNAPFGVCLLKSGGEVAGGDETLVLESVGCLATIVDCDVEQMGVLLLRTRGLSRFRLMSWRIETDGLLRGMIETIEDDQPMDQAVYLAKLAACAEVLERIIAKLRERDAESLPFLEPFQLEDACWVSNRLAEVLPLPLRARQKLMELRTAATRLDAVHEYMQRHQLL